LFLKALVGTVYLFVEIKLLAGTYVHLNRDPEPFDLYSDGFAWHLFRQGSHS
jgi:hypothetical protein